MRCFVTIIYALFQVLFQWYVWYILIAKFIWLWNKWNVTSTKTKTRAFTLKSEVCWFYLKHRTWWDFWKWKGSQKHKKRNSESIINHTSSVVYHDKTHKITFLLRKQYFLPNDTVLPKSRSKLSTSCYLVPLLNKRQNNLKFKLASLLLGSEAARNRIQQQKKDCNLSFILTVTVFMFFVFHSPRIIIR